MYNYSTHIMTLTDMHTLTIQSFIFALNICTAVIVTVLCNQIITDNSCNVHGLLNQSALLGWHLLIRDYKYP